MAKEFAPGDRVKLHSRFGGKTYGTVVRHHSKGICLVAVEQYISVDWLEKEEKEVCPNG